MSEIINKLSELPWDQTYKGFKELSNEEIRKIALKLLEEEYERQYRKKNPPLSDEQKEGIIRAFLDGKTITSWSEGLGNPGMRYSKDEVSVLRLIRDMEEMYVFEHFEAEEN